MRGAILWLLGLAAAQAASFSSAHPPAASPQPTFAAIEVEATVDKAEVTIGTPIRYTLEVRGNAEAEVVVPVLSGNLGSFAITDFGEEQTGEADSRVLSRRWYKLVAYSPGQYVVPGPSVEYRVAGGGLEAVKANDVPVTVRSLLEAAGDPAALDIRDIAQPIEVPFDWRLGAAALAGAAGLALAGGLAYRLARRRRSAQPVSPARAPEEIAMEELRTLGSRGLPEAGKFDEYYVALSSIVRRYLEGRFSLHAPEMTTEEFLQTAQRAGSLKPDHRRLLGDFLGESDLVKFARYIPAVEQAKRAHEAARRFVEESGRMARV